MKLAITGAGGFLGTELLKQLSAMNDVTVYAFTFDFERQRPGFVNADNIIVIDNSEAADFDFSETDILLNLAFPRNVDDKNFAKGLDFIKDVLLKAFSDNVGAVINISSQSVYSQKRGTPANENEPIVLESKYAVGKYCSEQLVNSLFRNKKHTNLRLASLIGAGFNQRITNKFAEKIKNGEQITITGGSQLFGFLDVRDAVSGIIAMIKSNDPEWEECYNFGTNNAYSLQEIAECAYKTGSELGYSAPGIILNKDDSWQNSAILCDKFYEKFNWYPSFTLEDTMIDIFEKMV